MEIIIDGKKISEGDVYTWNDTYATVTGRVNFGEWVQDGSGGEYQGTPCIGFYVEVINIKSLPGDTDEEIYEFYPDYYKNRSLLDLLRDGSVSGLSMVLQ